MSHVSISRSYAVLVGLESYVRTRRRVKTAEKLVVREKDKLLHPDKLKEEEEASRDKSQSAEKERLWLAQQREAAEREAREQEASRRQSGKFSRLLDKFKSRKDTSARNSTSTTASGDHSIKGDLKREKQRTSGPEDGIPAPEGER